jgi:hypothetical protein
LLHLPTKSPPPVRIASVYWIAAALLFVFYAALTISQWGLTYIDFGDGNYMYISRRIAEGAVVYRDILAPQPPCHLFLGAGVLKLAALCGLHGADAIVAIRIASLIIRLASFMLVMHLAWRAWRRPLAMLLAGGLFLFLPVGFWWAMAWQSEPLEMLFLLAMMACALRRTIPGDIFTGVFAALAALTNATAAPFLLILVLYFAAATWRTPRRLLCMLIPCGLIAGLVTLIMQLWTGGEFWRNIFEYQVGTFTPMPYAINKLNLQGQKILYNEGFFLAVALIGFARFARTSPLDPVSRGGLAWFFAATLLSFFYMIKGGTVDYIFSLSEPAIAILAGGELAVWIVRWLQPGDASPVSRDEISALKIDDAGYPIETPKPPARPFALMVFVSLILCFFALGPIVVFYRILLTGQTYEASEQQVQTVTRQLTRFSGPGDRILAPPFYAVAANRTLWGDYSEIFIWSMNYRNALQDGDTEAIGYRKIQDMAQAIAGRQLPIIVLEMDQTGMIPEVMLALKKHYRPIQPRPGKYLLHTLNTRLGFFVPELEAPLAPGEATQAEAWTEFQNTLRQTYGEDQVRKFNYWLSQPLPAINAPEPLE